MQKKNKILEVNNVFSGYGETEILHGVSIEIYENEIVKFEQKEDGHYHVKDTMGKIWYVDKNNLFKI